MPFTVIIPSRMSSTRLPGKPLKDIAGKPMVIRVAEQATKSGADRVVVAADSAAIVEACTANGFEAVLTREDHPTGTDRLAEAVDHLGLADEAIVVNVQGDEPLIPPSVVTQVASLLEEKTDCAIATAAHRLYDVESFLNPNVVKVEIDTTGHALTFTRASVPWPRDAFSQGTKNLPEGLPVLHHIGLYAYRASFLKRFPSLPRASIERFESLEQLRALWHGYRIAVAVLEENLPAGVDTQADLDRVRAVYASHG